MPIDLADLDVPEGLEPRSRIGWLPSPAPVLDELMHALRPTLESGSAVISGGELFLVADALLAFDSLIQATDDDLDLEERLIDAIAFQAAALGSWVEQALVPAIARLAPTVAPFDDLDVDVRDRAFAALKAACAPYSELAADDGDLGGIPCCEELLARAPAGDVGWLDVAAAMVVDDMAEVAVAGSGAPAVRDALCYITDRIADDEGDTALVRFVGAHAARASVAADVVDCAARAAAWPLVVEQLARGRQHAVALDEGRKVAAAALVPAADEPLRELARLIHALCDAAADGPRSGGRGRGRRRR